jgi:hypothetical protein
MSHPPSKENKKKQKKSVQPKNISARPNFLAFPSPGLLSYACCVIKNTSCSAMNCVADRGGVCELKRSLPAEPENKNLLKTCRNKKKLACFLEAIRFFHS